MGCARCLHAPQGSETRAQVVRCLNMEPHPQDPQQQGAFAPFPGTTPSPSHLASPAKRMRPAGAQFQPHTPSSASPSQQQAISLLAAAPLNTLPLSLHPSLSPQQPPLSSQLALGASALPIPALANVTPIKAPPPTGTRLATPPHPAFSPTAPAALAAAAAAAPAGPPPAGPALQPDPAISRVSGARGACGRGPWLRGPGPAACRAGSPRGSWSGRCVWQGAMHAPLLGCCAHGTGRPVRADSDGDDASRP